MDPTMTVTEAARNFADLVNRTYYRGDSTILLRSGEPVAMMVPVAGSRVTGREWMLKWRSFPRLNAQEADSFAADIESSRGNLFLTDLPWD